VPDQQVGVPCAAVDVRDQGVEPDQSVRDVAVDHEAAVVAHRARQEVDGQVHPGARGDELLHLLVGFSTTDLGVDLDQGQIGYGQVEPARQRADHDLGDQRLRTLAGGGELHHVGAEVVGLDQPRQRSALAQRREVGRRGHRGQHGPTLGNPSGRAFDPRRRRRVI
jgi:hypothetical protein